MHYSRNAFKILWLICIIISSGCVHVTYTTSLNDDESLSFEIEVATNPLIASLGSRTFRDIEAALRADGFDVSFIDEGSVRGLRAYRYYEPCVAPCRFISGTPFLNLTEDDGVYSFRLALDVDDYELNENDRRIIDAIKRGYIILRVVFHSPTVPLSHNANQVSEDGKMLTWVIDHHFSPIYATIRRPQHIEE